MLSFTAGKKFDLAVAALAAVSAGFVTFAMPEPVFAGLILATPLPELLAAARPPLGETARIAAIAASASAAFAAVFLLLRLLGRAPARRHAVALVPAGAPRIRKADAHPDAPIRHPLLAARELGEPLELDLPEVGGSAEETIRQEPRPRPLPAFLVAEESDDTVQPPQAAGKPESLAGLSERLPPSSAVGEASLGDMVKRIEAGIGRKRQALASGPGDAAPAAAAADGGQVRHRLRSAISELQKISVQGA